MEGNQMEINFIGVGPGRLKVREAKSII